MSQRYDSANRTLWVSCSLDADSLLPADEVSHLNAIRSAGMTPDGHSVVAVNVVFSDAGCAEYNESALSFSQIGTFVGSLDAPQPLGAATDFGVKEDFGV